jgi:hypothetical protein
MRRGSMLLLCAAAYLTACADDPVAPISEAGRSPSEASTEVEAGVAALGLLIERAGSTLVLEQQEIEFRPASHLKTRPGRHTLAIGRRGDALQVLTDASTQIYVSGARVSSLSAVPLRTQLLVAGTRDGSTLRANLVTDLSGAGPPSASHTIVGNSTSQAVAVRALAPSAAADFTASSTTSLCLGQDMDYVDPSVHEFHGCWGGPAASDNWEIPNIPFMCPLVGCFVLDQVSYTFALGGWIYDWPFRFTASSPGLIYHVPGSVSMNVTPLPVLGTAFTFTGGLGFDFGLNVDFCTITGCSDVGTFHLSVLSMIHQTTLAAPLRSTDRLELAEVSCPSVGVIAISGVPIDPLALGLCEDLDLVGRPFSTVVAMDGATGDVPVRREFDGTAKSIPVRPDAATVRVAFQDFSWSPQMDVGFSFRLKSFGITLWDSPAIPITGGAWRAISTPFPGTDFSVATDPLSPVTNLRYLFQPTSATVAVIPVAPAPTQLVILSSTTLAEGSPVMARLTESHDGSPISGVPLRFIATSAGATQTTVATTNLNGVAQIVLPNGEHTIVVQFPGSQFYLPASASQGPIFVYHPTTFVIWGGNAEGIAVGRRYNFWGSQWHKQVTGGAFDADASFKGYAFSVSGASWIGAPGTSVRPPAQVSQYIGVIVATQIARAGVNATGNVAARVVLRVENPASYAPNPGHAAWGVMTSPIPPTGLSFAAGG